jgi:hypothetical protein
MADGELKEVLEGIKSELERNRIAGERAEAAHREEMTELNREMSARYERLWREISGELREGRESLRGMSRSIAVNTARTEAGTAMTKAHTEAIFRMLDRWSEGGGASPATS